MRAARRSGPHPSIACWSSRLRVCSRVAHPAVTGVTRARISWQPCGAHILSVGDTELKTLRLFLFFALLPAMSLAAKEATKGAAPAPFKKACSGGVVVKLSAASAAQGGLLLAEISGVKTPTEIAGEWEGKATPIWRETPSDAVLH